MWEGEGGKGPKYAFRAIAVVSQCAGSGSGPSTDSVLPVTLVNSMLGITILTFTNHLLIPTVHFFN